MTLLGRAGISDGPIKSRMHAMVSSILRLNSQRIVLLIRIIVGCTLLLLAATDPRDIGFQAEPDDFLCLGYLAMAIGAMVIGWQDWFIDLRLSIPLFVMDVVSFLLIPSMIEPLESGYRIASLIICAFVIYQAIVRFGLSNAVIVTLALNVASLVIVFDLSGALTSGFVPHHLSIDASEALRISILLGGVSMLALWIGPSLLGERQGFNSYGAVRTLASDDGDKVGICEALAAISGARCAIFRWRDRATGRQELFLAPQTPHLSIDCLLQSVDHAIDEWRRGFLFDRRRRRLVLCEALSPIH